MKIFLFLLIFLPFSSRADSLGRLFFTPQQRAMMDSLAKNPTRTVQESGHSEGRGVVERQGGGKTVWVEGIPRHIEPGKKQ